MVSATNCPEAGFAPLVEVLNLMARVPTCTPMTSAHPLYPIWQKAISDHRRGRLEVACCRHEGALFVLVEEFVPWAENAAIAMMAVRTQGAWKPPTLATRERLIGEQQAITREPHSDGHTRDVAVLLHRWREFLGDSGPAPKAIPAEGKRDVLEQRKRALVNWLEEKEIPEGERNPLHPKYGITSLAQIYGELTRYPEFRSQHGSGEAINLDTFQRKFWREQRICKLPDKAQP